MKKVVSFCLYGYNATYIIGMKENIKLAKQYYSDWEVRIYHNNTVPEKYINEYKELNAICILCENIGENKLNWEGMFWRWLPLDDPDVDIWISRDADSRLSDREAKIVNQWINSGKTLHSIRDHRCHFNYIMGGLFGINNKLFCERYKFKTVNEIIKELSVCYKERPYNVDQIFLNDNLWKILKDDVMAHISKDGRRVYETDILIPSAPDFIGKQYRLNDFPENIIKHLDKNKGCYWKESTSPSVYWSNSSIDIKPDIKFNNLGEYFMHRAEHGFPQNWSQIQILDGINIEEKPKEIEKKIDINENNFTEFDKIIIIHLNKLKDRKENILKQINKLSNVVIIDAIDKDLLDINDLKEKNLIGYPGNDYCKNINKCWCAGRGHNDMMITGRIACIWSHSLVYNYIISNDIQNALIFEDDFLLSDNFDIIIKDIKYNLPKDYDLIYFAHSKKKINNYTHHNKYFKKIFTGLSETVCYSITKNTAIKLLENLFPIRAAADGYIRQSIDYLKTIKNVYVCKNDLCKNLSLSIESNINTTIDINNKLEINNNLKLNRDLFNIDNLITKYICLDSDKDNKINECSKNIFNDNNLLDNNELQKVYIQCLKNLEIDTMNYDIYDTVIHIRSFYNNDDKYYYLQPNLLYYDYIFNNFNLGKDILLVYGLPKNPIVDIISKKYNIPIKTSSKVEDDLLIMKNCKNLIWDTSTLCWVASIMSTHNNHFIFGDYKKYIRSNTFVYSNNFINIKCNYDINRLSIKNMKLIDLFHTNNITNVSSNLKDNIDNNVNVVKKNIPLVSIAISTFESGGKGHELLKHNLDHILKQDYDNIEIIISDHSSDNKIKELCKEYDCKKYPIKYIHNPEYKGNSSQNTNNAIKYCNGEYIKILFIDDYLYNESAITIIVENFEKNADKKWLVHSYRHTKDYKDFYNLHHPKFSHDIVFCNRIGTPSCLTIHKSVKERFDENLKWFMDSELYKRILDKYGQPIFLHTKEDIKPLMINLHHDGQVTNTSIDKDLIVKEKEYITNKTNDKTLMELVDNSRTDKNTIHAYLELYQKLFKSKKSSANNILEVGLGQRGNCHCGSAKLWFDYFLNADIYAIDIYDESYLWEGIKNKERIKLFTSTNAYNEIEFNEKLLKKNIKFDILLDDGSHILDDMKQFIKLYTQILKDDGILIIEDIPKIEWLDILKNEVPEHLKSYIKTYDLRYKKNRFDDIVFTIDLS